MYQFKTKQGFCTSYALACGYIDRFDAPHGSVTLSKECGVLHVQAIDWRKQSRAGDYPQIRGWNDPAGFRVWECPATLHAARKLFRKLVRTLTAQEG